MRAPIAPRLSPQLDRWDGDRADTTIEIDRAAVQATDFTSASRLAIDTARLERVLLTAALLDKFELNDVLSTKLEAAALRAYKASLLRVSLQDCRLTGAEFAEGQFVDCTFKNVQLDTVGFRFATFKRVRFEDCLLRQADFSNANLAQVTFVGCDLEAATFSSATCTDVDVSTEDLSQVRGILGLKGATISTEQLILLAPLLASELGFRVS